MSTVTPSNQFVDVRPEIQNSRILSQPQATEFEVRSMEEQQRRLKYFTDTTNEELINQQENELFINLSLVTIFRRLSTTIISIINELLDMDRDTQLSDFVFIFVKEDRLVYIGLLFVMISLSVYLIDITS